MKQIKRFTMTAIVAALLFATVLPAAKSSVFRKDGKELFLAQKCNVCHSVSTAGITATNKSPHNKAPDLVNIKEDAATLTKYLHKQTAINGKKHVKSVSLPAGEVTTLVDWLLAQKK